MRPRHSIFSWAFALASVTPIGVASADDQTTRADATKPDPSYVNLLEASRAGRIEAKAEGTGDGRMTLIVTNKSDRKLNVVLPPGLVAAGATGQFGGGGGGMGGGGMGGGGMGGGGMGGGGMGGGGMGGQGGQQGGQQGGGGGGTMPPMMGMMTLGQMIMSLTGERDSWDQRSLMSGMMGGMGGGMGGMGGGMGGMGGGGGFRSVAPTGPPVAAIEPGQTLRLPTPLVSLGATTAVPAKGEKLRLGDVAEMNDDARVAKALRRLNAEKAPVAVTQAVMWHLVGGLDWNEIARRAGDRLNGQELALAQRLIRDIDSPDSTPAVAGVLYFEVTGDGPAATALRSALQGKGMLGLATKVGIPAAPVGPAVACLVKFSSDEATVVLTASDAKATAWVPAGKFTLAAPADADGPALTEALAEGVLGRLVRAQLSQGPRMKGRPSFRVKIENYSPLVLNGLALAGASSKSDAATQDLAGLALPPRRSLTVVADAALVERLGLKAGVKVHGADLSGL